MTASALQPANTLCERDRARRRWTDYRRLRGMNRWYDILDWVGGYLYEFATPDQIFEFYRTRGFTLVNMQCGGEGLGCNQFVFERHALAAAS